MTVHFTSLTPPVRDSQYTPPYSHCTGENFQDLKDQTLWNKYRWRVLPQPMYCFVASHRMKASCSFGHEACLSVSEERQIDLRNKIKGGWATFEGHILLIAEVTLRVCLAKPQQEVDKAGLRDVTWRSLLCGNLLCRCQTAAAGQEITLSVRMRQIAKRTIDILCLSSSRWRLAGGGVFKLWPPDSDWLQRGKDVR